jgi:hypothetical protein
MEFAMTETCAPSLRRLSLKQSGKQRHSSFFPVYGMGSRNDGNRAFLDTPANLFSISNGGLKSRIFITAGRDLRQGSHLTIAAWKAGRPASTVLRLPKTLTPKIHVNFISRRWRRQKFTRILSPNGLGTKNSREFHLPPVVAPKIHANFISRFFSGRNRHLQFNNYIKQ